MPFIHYNSLGQPEHIHTRYTATIYADDREDWTLARVGEHLEREIRRRMTAAHQALPVTAWQSVQMRMRRMYAGWEWEITVEIEEMDHTLR